MRYNALDTDAEYDITHCNTLQLTAPLSHTATHCTTLTHCNSLHHTTNVPLQIVCCSAVVLQRMMQTPNSTQHIATHCNTLRLAAPHCNDYSARCSIAVCQHHMNSELCACVCMCADLCACMCVCHICFGMYVVTRLPP